MEKFTKGPWSVVEVPHTGLIGVQRGDRVLCLDGDQETDANLMAAAPELLEALEWLHGVACNQLGDDWTAVVNAARVIRKARGETQ